MSWSMKELVLSLIIAAVITAGTTAVGVWLGWIVLAELSLLEVFAVFTSYSCTWMFVRQTRLSYPMGILTTFLYSILFYQWEMYAIAAFNLYLVGSLAYGYWRWGPDGNPIPVTRLKFDRWLAGYGVLGLGIYGLIVLCNWLLSGATTVTENLITVGSGVAQFMLDNKKLENWLVWMAVNVLSIGFYFNGGLYLVTFQYVFFLANAVYGFYTWRKSI